LVLAAVVDDVLRIAGIVAVAFVIYGAVQYITSQGDPESTAHARTTIINALIGLAVAIIAVSLVGFLGTEFGS
jgi:MFS superfamily sulfate permease-like transporter